MAPPGTRIVTHEIPNHRRTWSLPLLMDKMVGTVDQLSNNMDVTQCTSLTPEVNEL
jgi:hypothetical protein